MTRSEHRYRLTKYEVTTVVLIVILVALTLFSYVEFQYLQNQINRITNLEQTSLSVVSGMVTTSTDNLANVPYASSIMFRPGPGLWSVNSTIQEQHYITYLTDGLGYGVFIQFSNRTLCYVGTFVPRGTFVVHNFSC